MMSLHLVVEADDERALARGLQGLGVRIAKALEPVDGAQRDGLRRPLPCATAAFADRSGPRARLRPDELPAPLSGRGGAVCAGRPRPVQLGLARIRNGSTRGPCA